MATGAALGYDPAMLSAPVLSLRGITKVFPGVRANDRVDLEIHRGEVHALVGENGAGKSTLMKILYGFYRADAGEIRFDGHPTEIREPEDARRLGIGMVFQDFVQIPALSVAENLALFFPNLAFILDRGRDRAAHRDDVQALWPRRGPVRPRLAALHRRAAEGGGAEAPARGCASAHPGRADAQLGAPRDRGAVPHLRRAPPRWLRGGVHHPQAPGCPGVRRPHHGHAPWSRRRYPPAGRCDRRAPSSR